MAERKEPAAEKAAVGSPVVKVEASGYALTFTHADGTATKVELPAGAPQ